MSKLNNDSEAAFPDERTSLLNGQHAWGHQDESVPQLQDLQDRPASTESPEEPSVLNLVIVLGSTYLGIFLNALDMTIIATLSHPITSSFKSFALFSWLASAYLIANAAFQPISGKLSDIYGRRAGLILANIFFLAGTLFCGIANSQGFMIFGRLVAGIGGGCISTLATVITSDLVPLRKRGFIQGVSNLFFAVGAGLGGVVGGFISDTWSWRWAFLFQVPLILLSTIIVAFVVKIPVKDTTGLQKIKRVDFIGAITLVTSLVLLLLGLNAGGNTVPWSHPLVVVSIPLATVVFALFVFIEDKIAVEPIIPVRLMLKPTVFAACMCNWFVCMAVYAFMFYGPIFFQVQGASDFAAGTRLVPLSLGTAVGSVGSGLVMRATGKYYRLIIGVITLFIASTLVNIFVLQLNIPEWPPFVTFTFFGISYGALLTITLIALISAVTHEFQAVITSMLYAFRSTGSTTGVAISSAVFQNILKSQLWQELGGYKDAAKWINALHESFEVLEELPETLKPGALRAYLDALESVWITIAVMALLASICALMVREHTLFNTLQRQ